MKKKSKEMINDLRDYLSKPPKIIGDVIPLFPRAKFTIGEQVRIVKRKRICIVDKVTHVSTGFIYALNGPNKYAWYNENELIKV